MVNSHVVEKKNDRGHMSPFLVSSHDTTSPNYSTGLQPGYRHGQSQEAHTSTATRPLLWPVHNLTPSLPSALPS